MNLTPHFEAVLFLPEAVERVTAAQSKLLTEEVKLMAGKGNTAELVAAYNDLTAAYEWYGEVQYMADFDEFPVKAIEDACIEAMGSHARLQHCSVVGTDLDTWLSAYNDHSQDRKKVEAALVEYAKGRLQNG